MAHSRSGSVDSIMHAVELVSQHQIEDDLNLIFKKKLTVLYATATTILDQISKKKVKKTDLKEVQRKWIKATFRALLAHLPNEAFHAKGMIASFITEKQNQSDKKDGKICKSTAKKQLLNYILDIAHRVALQYVYVHQARQKKNLFLQQHGKFNAFKERVVPENVRAPRRSLQKRIQESNAIIPYFEARFSEVLLVLSGPVQDVCAKSAKFYKIKQEIAVLVQQSSNQWSGGADRLFTGTVEVIQEQKNRIEVLMKKLEKQQRKLTLVKKAIESDYVHPLPEFPNCAKPPNLFSEKFPQFQEWAQLQAMEECSTAQRVFDEFSFEKASISKKIEAISGRNANTLLQLSSEMNSWRELEQETRDKLRLDRIAEDHLKGSGVQHDYCLVCLSRKADAVLQKANDFFIAYSKVSTAYQFVDAHHALSDSIIAQFSELRKRTFPVLRPHGLDLYLLEFDQLTESVNKLMDQLLPEQIKLQDILQADAERIAGKNRQLKQKVDLLNQRFSHLSVLWQTLMAKLPKHITWLSTGQPGALVEMQEFVFGEEYYTQQKWAQLKQEHDRLMALPQITLSDVEDKINAIDFFLKNAVEVELRNAGGDSHNAAQGKTLERIQELNQLIKTADSKGCFNQEKNLSVFKKASFFQMKKELKLLIQSSHNASEERKGTSHSVGKTSSSESLSLSISLSVASAPPTPPLWSKAEAVSPPPPRKNTIGKSLLPAPQKKHGSLLSNVSKGAQYGLLAGMLLLFVVVACAFALPPVGLTLMAGASAIGLGFGLTAGAVAITTGMFALASAFLAGCALFGATVKVAMSVLSNCSPFLTASDTNGVSNSSEKNQSTSKRRGSVSTFMKKTGSRLTREQQFSDDIASCDLVSEPVQSTRQVRKNLRDALDGVKPRARVARGAFE